MFGRLRLRWQMADHRTDKRGTVQGGISAAHTEIHCAIYAYYYTVQSPYQETKQLQRKYPETEPCDKTAAIQLSCVICNNGRDAICMSNS